MTLFLHAQVAQGPQGKRCRPLLALTSRLGERTVYLFCPSSVLKTNQIVVMALCPRKITYYLQDQILGVKVLHAHLLMRPSIMWLWAHLSHALLAMVIYRITTDVALLHFRGHAFRWTAVVCAFSHKPHPLRLVAFVPHLMTFIHFHVSCEQVSMLPSINVHSCHQVSCYQVSAKVPSVNVTKCQCY